MRAAKILLVLISALAILALAGVAYFAATFIDERVTSGEAYGFEIGQTKDQVAEAIRAIYPDGLFVRRTIDGEMTGPKVPFAMPANGFGPFLGKDEWELHFDDDSIDLILLRFSDGRLTEIWRHRQTAELP